MSLSIFGYWTMDLFETYLNILDEDRIKIFITELEVEIKSLFSVSFPCRWYENLFCILYCYIILEYLYCAWSFSRKIFQPDLIDLEVNFHFFLLLAWDIYRSVCISANVSHIKWSLYYIMIDLIPKNIFISARSETFAYWGKTLIDNLFTVFSSMHSFVFSPKCKQLLLRLKSKPFSGCQEIFTSLDNRPFTTKGNVCHMVKYHPLCFNYAQGRFSATLSLNLKDIYIDW